MLDSFAISGYTTNARSNGVWLYATNGVGKVEVFARKGSGSLSNHPIYFGCFFYRSNVNSSNQLKLWLVHNGRILASVSFDWLSKAWIILSLCSAMFLRWFAQTRNRLRLRLEEDVRGEKTIYA